MSSLDGGTIETVYINRLPSISQSLGLINEFNNS